VTGTAALQTAEAAGSGTTADGKPYTGDTVNVTGTPSGTFASKDVANNISVSVGGLSLTGGQAGNYSLTALSLSANITPKALTVTGPPANNKFYAPPPAATVTGTAALQTAEAAGSGTTADGKPYTGALVSVSGTATGAFTSKDVGTSKTVNITG